MKYKGLILATALAVSELFGTQVLAEEPSDDVKAFEQMFGEGPQEEDVYRADKLLVSATGSLKPVHLAPSVATVITAEEIEEMGATTLDEVLETVPGLHVFPSGAWLFSPIWSIRGLHTSTTPQVLLLLDNIPLTHSYGGTRQSNYTMPVSMISRIEVIRGPGSAVHGADAFSGVVNVITKDNFEINGSEFGGRYGSFGTYDFWAQHGGQYKGWDVWLSVETQKTDGDDDRVIGQDYLHSLGFSTLSNAPGPLDTDYEYVESYLGLRKGDFSLRFYGAWNIESGIGPGLLQALTYGNDVDGRQLVAHLKYENDHVHPDWNFQAQLSSVYLKSDTLFDFFPHGFANLVGNPITESHTTGAEVTAFFEGFHPHKFRISSGWKWFDLNSDQYKNFGDGVASPGTLTNIDDTEWVFISDQNRRLWFASLQDEFSFHKDWSLTGGVRFDDYSDFGSTINPRAALVWEPNYYLTIKLLYGQAFRAPSFQEQYLQNNPSVDGHPDIEPEEIETYELAFDFRPTPSLKMGLSFYVYYADEMIEIIDDPSDTDPPKFENYGELEGRGLEIDVEWSLNSTLNIRSSFAYQDTKNQKTDADIADTPERQFYLNPHWEFAKDWSLDGQYCWVGERNREEGDSREEIDDYDIVNLTLRRKNIAEHWDFALAVRNLFNEDVREPSPYDPTAPGGAHVSDDYPMESRAVWGEIRVKF